MPYDQVMNKFGKGTLTSGSKSGPKVRNRKQAVAIMLSEKRKAAQGKDEYMPGQLRHPGLGGMRKPKVNLGPSFNFRKKFNL